MQLFARGVVILLSRRCKDASESGPGSFDLENCAKETGGFKVQFAELFMCFSLNPSIKEMDENHNNCKKDFHLQI